jgi:UDP-glucose 4-epimerase
VRVLVTGAAGFIASHLAERLHAAGHELTGIDNLETGRRTNWSEHLGDVYEESIADRDVLYGIANKVCPDLIVHAAASYSNPDYWHRDTDTNVTGSINVAIAAKHHGARVIYFQTALPPISSYAISKIAGEEYLRLSGVPLTVFRLANMYGPRNVSGPIPTFWKRLTAGEPCTVVDTARDMVFVDDLVDAVMTSIDRGAEGRFDICSGLHLPIEKLYWAVASELGIETPPGHAASGSDDVKQMQLDGTLAATRLGWKPRMTLAGGVALAVGWYAEHGIEQTFTHLTLPSLKG